MPQQPQGHECGIYVAVFVRKILEGLRTASADANGIQPEDVATILATLKSDLGSKVHDPTERKIFRDQLHGALIDFDAIAGGHGLDCSEALPNFFEDINQVATCALRHAARNAHASSAPVSVVAL